MGLSDDEKFMKECFKLAKKGEGNVLPNPMTGCVIVKSGRIISKGYHKKYGGFHAERNAILSAKEDIKGASLYVNLEPCSHFGKTPPCTDLIIEKKIARVIYSVNDENPLVDGKTKLIEAGIEVKNGILEEEGKELNKVFLKNIKTKTPYIALKTAVTLDSKIATINYNSKWITNAASRKKVMQLRSEYQAVITGSNTVKFDNPKLTSRIEGGTNPIRIVMDRNGMLPLNSNIFKNNGVRVIAVDNTDKKYPKHIEKIGFKNMKTFLKTLYRMGICSILIEGGGKLNSAFLKSRAVDEVYQFVAPKILGGGISFVSGFNPVKLSDAILAYDLKVEKFENDILFNYKLGGKK